MNKITDELKIQIRDSIKNGVLNLNSSSLLQLPSDIALLNSVVSLGLSGNKIKLIPNAIMQMRELTWLDLSHNRISELPPEILNLPKLKYIDLTGNPLQSPPPEIAEKGLTAIRSYFAQIKEQGYEKVYECKLVVVGEPGAGKTTLVRKILNESYKVPCDEVSTHGIEVTKWGFKTSENINYMVNIWDFGGQELYHSTHQLFLTRRSLYILVADTRKADTDFNWWISIIGQLADKSPIIIVKNEKYDRIIELDEHQLRTRFHYLKDFYSTNLASNRGLKILEEAIIYHIKQLPHVGSNLPKNWIKARSKLQDIHKNFIPLEQYLDICDENNIRELPDKLQLSSYLHDIGAQIHFQDDPLLRKTIILNPKWATRAIYSILDNQVITKQKGRFSIDQAKAIWSIQDYEGMQDELVQLMLKFKLCYKIRLTDSFIAPQLLPINPPYYEWDHHDNLILKIKYDYMPKGLLSNLIVALHIYITREDLVWRNGAVFVRDKTSAEVITCKDDNEIRIRLHGIFKKDLLSIILYEIDNIHLNFSEIKHDKFVPCNCSTCASTLEPHFYPLSKLNEFIENNKFEIQCYKPPYQMVSILPMIDDIFKSEGRKSLSESQNSFFYKDEISTNAQEVFVSYAWGGESETLANNLEDYLRTKGIFVIRDKNEIRYKQSINDFMRRMGHGKCVVIVISKKYLESENCMLELLLLLQNNDFRDRLFPIVLPDSKIHDAISRIHYIQYWEDKSKMLKETLSKISPEYMSATHETLNLYCDIRRSIDQISSFLSDMKALDFDTVTNPDLEQLYLALKTRLDIV